MRPAMKPISFSQNRIFGLKSGLCQVKGRVQSNCGTGQEDLNRRTPQAPSARGRSGVTGQSPPCRCGAPSGWGRLILFDSSDRALPRFALIGDSSRPEQRAVKARSVCGLRIDDPRGDLRDGVGDGGASSHHGHHGGGHHGGHDGGGHSGGSDGGG